MRNNLIPLKARLERTLKVVRQFISNINVCKLPVDPYKIYEDFDWALFSCKEIEEFNGKNDPLLLKIRKDKADALTFRDRQTGTYITVYDENNLPERIRWTLAHEIGHIKLNHLTDFNETCMSRGGINSQQYKVLEREANIFAAEFLSPMALLVLLEATESNKIVSYCQISKVAADNREREIKSYWTLKLYSESTSFFKKQFKHYLSSITKIISIDQKQFKDVSIDMNKHSDIPVDKDYRFTMCPRCYKNNFSKKAKYCTMCGLYLFNSCTNTYHEEDSYCNHINNGDARYCEICGAPTALYKLGLLRPWEELNNFSLVKQTT